MPYPTSIVPADRVTGLAVHTPGSDDSFEQNKSCRHPRAVLHPVIFLPSFCREHQYLYVHMLTEALSWCRVSPVVVLETKSHDIVILTLVRSLRVVRVIRLATHIPGFDQILAACTYPARVLLNVFVLLGIGVYVFANIGVALFSDVEIEVKYFVFVRATGVLCCTRNN